MWFCRNIQYKALRRVHMSGAENLRVYCILKTLELPPRCRWTRKENWGKRMLLFDSIVSHVYTSILFCFAAVLKFYMHQMDRHSLFIHFIYWWHIEQGIHIHKKYIINTWLAKNPFRFLAARCCCHNTYNII